MNILLDDSAETITNLNSTNVVTEPEFPEESVEQLLQRAALSILDAEKLMARKPEIAQTSSVPPLVVTDPIVEPQSSIVVNETESDDDVIFVGEENTVINLCSPDVGNKHRGTAVPAKSKPALPSGDDPKENAVTCPICMESAVGRKPHSTHCGHIYCGDCIKTAIKTSNKCPLCNKKLTVKNIFPVFI